MRGRGIIGAIVLVWLLTESSRHGNADTLKLGKQIVSQWETSR